MKIVWTILGFTMLTIVGVSGLVFVSSVVDHISTKHECKCDGSQ